MKRASEDEGVALFESGATCEFSMSDFNPSYLGPRPDIIELIPKRCRRILDVGCATGSVGRALKEARKDVHVTGVELDPEMAAVSGQRLDVVERGDVCDLLAHGVFDGRAYDCIILADVLEHIVDPWTTLGLLAARLGHEGVIVASLPNVRHYTTIASILFAKRWPYRDRGIHDRTHRRFFAYRNVVELFEGAGLTIGSLRRHYRLLEAPYRVNRLSRVLAVKGGAKLDHRGGGKLDH